MLVDQLQGDMAGLVVDAHHRVVLPGLLHVVDVDGVAEDLDGVGVLPGDGRASEGDEGGVGHGLAQVIAEAVQQVAAGGCGGPRRR